MSPKAVVVLLALVVVGTAVYIQSTGAKPGKPAPPPSSGPPADAEYLDVGPGGVLAAGALKPGPKRDEAMDAVLGKWNGPEGWQGVVEKISSYKGREALILTEYSSTIIGGSYTVIAVVGEDHGTEKGKTVHVQGRVADVVVKAGSVGVLNQIVLEDARIVK